VNPTEGEADSGFDWMRGRGTGELPGNYMIGGYYNSSDTQTSSRTSMGFLQG